MKSLLPDDYLRTALRLLLSYFALALGGIALSSQETSVATLWFANAAAIVFLYRSQGVFWLGLLMLAGCANALANLSFGRPLYLVLSFLPGNVLEIAVGSWMLQRYCTSRNFLLSPLEIARTLLLAGVVPISVGSVVGAGVLSAYGLAPFDKVWFQWFEGAGIGVLAKRRWRLSIARGNIVLKALWKLLWPLLCAWFACPDTHLPARFALGRGLHCTSVHPHAGSLV